MILSDRDIKKAMGEGRLAFAPHLEPGQIGPASIDLRLASVFKTFNATKQVLLDPKQGLPTDFMEEIDIQDDDYFILHPGSFILASTVEYITVPDDLVVRVEGKSTLARMGILVHTAGFVDPGFEGNLTLEISNQSNLAVALYPNMFICQVAVETMTTPAEVPYNKRKKSLYCKQRGPTEAQSSNLF